MKRYTLFSLLASICLLLSIAKGSTIVILQPDHLTMTDLPPVGFGQSFTANGTYSIVAIDLIVSASAGGSDVTLGIYDFDSSLPSLGSTLLGSGTIFESDLSATPTWVRVQLSNPVPVVEGGEYAFTVIAKDPGGSATGWNNYGYNRNDVYAGGRYFPLSLSARTSDLAFGVVVVPEPAVLGIFALGCLFTTICRTRRHS